MSKSISTFPFLGGHLFRDPTAGRPTAKRSFPVCKVPQGNVNARSVVQDLCILLLRTTPNSWDEEPKDIQKDEVREGINNWHWNSFLMLGRK